MNAKEFKERLLVVADRINKSFDQKDIAPTMRAAEKGLITVEKIIGYCEDKLNPTPLEQRASSERMQSRIDRAKVRSKKIGPITVN